MIQSPAATGRHRLLFLVFDEFQITDPAELAIADVLLAALARRGLIVVLTGNRHPNTLNRSSLGASDQFVKRLSEFADCYELSTQDFRFSGQHATSPRLQSFIAALDSNLLRQLQSNRCAFSSMPEALQLPQRLSTMQIDVGWGRQWSIQSLQLTPNHRLAQLSFSDISRGVRSAADFAALCRHVDCIVITDCQTLHPLERDSIRRFITFIDCAYNAFTPIIAIFPGATTGSANDLSRLLDIAQVTIDEQAVATSIAEGVQFELELARKGLSYVVRISSISWLLPRRRRTESYYLNSQHSNQQ